MTRIAIVAALYVAVIGSGFWLSHHGRPYGVAFLAVHKLAAVAALVYLGVGAYRALRDGTLGSWGLAAGIATAVLFVGTVATGGLLSVGKEMPAAVHLAHRVTPYLTVLASAGLLYLLFPKQ